MAKQNIGKIQGWKDEHVERIVVQPRREDAIGERVDRAVAEGLARSRQAYIIEAVKERLERDGM